MEWDIPKLQTSCIFFLMIPFHWQWRNTLTTMQLKATHWMYSRSFIFLLGQEGWKYKGWNPEEGIQFGWSVLIVLNGGAGLKGEMIAHICFYFQCFLSSVSFWEGESFRRLQLSNAKVGVSQFLLEYFRLLCLWIYFQNCSHLFTMILMNSSRD